MVSFWLPPLMVGRSMPRSVKGLSISRLARYMPRATSTTSPGAAALHCGSQVLAGLHPEGGGPGRACRAQPHQRHDHRAQQAVLHGTSQPIDLSTRNSAAPISRFLKPT